MKVSLGLWDALGLTQLTLDLLVTFNAPLPLSLSLTPSPPSLPSFFFFSLPRVRGGSGEEKGVERKVMREKKREKTQERRN